jgi:hypothetical protein
MQKTKIRDIIFDIECYPNVFCVTFMMVETGQHITFELSQWKDDWTQFLEFIKRSQNNFVRWVGFNNYSYDYQVIHQLLKHPNLKNKSGAEKAAAAYTISMKIIETSKEERFGHMVWDNDHFIPQIDLFKIHHFDNNARATSLKKLEFNMRSKKIQDLPYKVGTNLNEEQKKELVKYNIHDVRETLKLYHKTADMIRFREELTKKYDKNFLNHNDTKIGKDYLIMELQNAGISCFTTGKDGKKPVQTKRPQIAIKDVIFHYFEFDRPEFKAVLNWMRAQIIKETKGVFTEITIDENLAKYANLKKVKGKIKNLNCIIDGFQFDFGTGGIHGSIESTIVEEDENHAIIDFDVTSLYPSIAIVNNVYPKHLTHKFCEIYARMKKDRMSYPKGSPENAMLKLALNGVYGDSNNPYSPFFDPQYTMTITINGQLMLCMLAEMYMKIEGLKMIQINTDGITIKVPRDKIPQVEWVNKFWQTLTGLDLERADYKKMFIRDVNNYLGLYTDGKLKRKGAYEYEKQLHQDQSALIVQKAAEAHLVHGANIEEFIKNHDDIFDFMLRTNVPRSSRLVLEFDENNHEELQNITRYFIAKEGGQLIKIMPPLKNKFEDRLIKIEDGFNVIPMNEMPSEINFRHLINFDWYIAETVKIVGPLWAGLFKEINS